MKTNGTEQRRLTMDDLRGIMDVVRCWENEGACQEDSPECWEGEVEYWYAGGGASIIDRLPSCQIKDAVMRALLFAECSNIPVQYYYASVGKTMHTGKGDYRFITDHKLASCAFREEVKSFVVAWQ